MEFSPPQTITTARSLIDFIMKDFTVDGAHMLVIGHGEEHYFGFGKYRGELDFNFLGLRNFIKDVEERVDDRDNSKGYLSFICLTSYVGAEPPPEGGTFRLSELRVPRFRYGWLLNNSMVNPLSAHSLKSMIRKENGVKMKSSQGPRPS